MKSLAWVKKLVLVLSIGLVIGAVGCSSKTVDSGGSPQSGSEATSAQGSVVTPRSLTGAWLGEAAIDQEKLQSKMAQLDKEAQALAGIRAKSFLSTAMAMEFHENGTVDNEVEVISTQGKFLREGSSAVWKVLETKPHALLVQIQEKLPNGTVATERMFFQFSADRNKMAVGVPVGPDLQGCDAMIVFERKSLPPTNVAAAPSSTISK